MRLGPVRESGRASRRWSWEGLSCSRRAGPRPREAEPGPAGWEHLENVAPPPVPTCVRISQGLSPVGSSSEPLDLSMRVCLGEKAQTEGQMDCQLSRDH